LFFVSFCFTDVLVSEKNNKKIQNSNNNNDVTPAKKTKQTKNFSCNHDFFLFGQWMNCSCNRDFLFVFCFFVFLSNTYFFVQLWHFAKTKKTNVRAIMAFFCQWMDFSWNHCFFCRRFLSMKELFVQTWFFVFLFLSNNELFVQSWLFLCFLVNEWTFRAIMTFCFCLVNEWTVRAITILEFVFLCVCQKITFRAIMTFC